MVALPRNTKISDIIDSVDDAEAYVRGVLENMYKCRREHGSALVKVGTTGRGISPHYRVAPAGDQSGDVSIEGFEKFLDTNYVAYDGRSHEKLPWGPLELKEAHWSEADMAFHEVEALLGQLRKPGYRR